MSESTRPHDSFERLYETHRRAVLAYCLRRASRSDAHDAVAETFAVAWRRMDDVPAGDGALPWLYAVAYRTLGNMHRSTRRRRKLAEKVSGTELTSPPIPLDTQVIRSAEAQTVLDAMTRLKPSDRELLRLTIWEELPREQVAKALGISREAVNQRFVRAVKRMGKELVRVGINPSGKGGGT